MHHTSYWLSLAVALAACSPYRVSEEGRAAYEAKQREDSVASERVLENMVSRATANVCSPIHAIEVPVRAEPSIVELPADCIQGNHRFRWVKFNVRSAGTVS